LSERLLVKATSDEHKKVRNWLKGGENDYFDGGKNMNFLRITDKR